MGESDNEKGAGGAACDGGAPPGSDSNSQQPVTESDDHARELAQASGAVDQATKEDEHYDAGDEKDCTGEDEEGLCDEEEEEEEESGDQYVVLKFLISTEAAGSIIGKNGVTVGELQVQSGTKIQLSKSREFFPGTSERMMLLCGSMSNVLVALHLVLTKLIADNVTMLTCTQSNPGEVSQIAMVVSHRLCGGIIGRGGSTINSFMEDSGAQLLVSPHSETTGYGERIIYVTGTREAQLRAVALIATKMADDPHYRTDEVPLSYSAEGYGAFGPMAHQHQYQNPLHHHVPHHHAGYVEAAAEVVATPSIAEPQVSATHVPADSNEEVMVHFMLPEEAVGVIIGKQGRTVQSIRQRSGARIKIEDSNGSGQRMLVLTGSHQSITAAEGFLVAHLRQQGKAAALQRVQDTHGPAQEVLVGQNQPVAPGPDDLKDAVAKGIDALQVS
mmetsp:Transcript_1930/g.5683  ORF Transcript_1930/g.5683 Transcript_1930/m.5683 type:complete len:444 (+) Transcript_1930:554-1885(+)